MEVIINGIYRHFKGHMYKVLAIATDSETLKKVVVYENIADSSVWTRDYDMFISKVDKEKYPLVECEYRFTLIEKK